MGNHRNTSNLIVDKIEVNLDFHIFDILDFELLLGFPLEKLHASQWSLDEKLRETASTTATSWLENSTEKHFPEQNPFEKMMHGSSFISTKPILFEMARFATSKGYDSEEILHFCDDEQSSTSTECEHLPASQPPSRLNYDLSR